jgi:uncharacterized membrane protein
MDISSTAGALALLIGIVAGLRALTAPAAVSWAARWGSLDVASTAVAFLGFAVTPWVLTLLAAGELVNDTRPTTPSRTVPVQFAARLLTGALSGGAIGAAQGALLLGAGAGVVGAVIGTLGGRAGRVRVAAFFGRDLPAAFIEDAVAIGGACLIMAALP